jgi:hypothetical protein
LRAQEAEGGPQLIHEDIEETPTAATHEYDPFSTETSTRAPLGEIHHNNIPLPESERTEQALPIKTTKGSKKGKASKKNTLNLVLANNENSLPSTEQEVLEDESQSDISSAAETASENLRRDSITSGTHQELVDTARPITPPSTAAKEACISLSRSPDKNLIAVQGSAPKTPRFDPVVHAEMPPAGQAAEQKSEDSFVGSITSRTPARMMAAELPAGDGPDSFVEDIISRSPSKHVTRIEDSVEAMDALEEAIEQVAEELPKAMGENLDSPVKTRTPRPTTAKTSPKQVVSAPAASARKTAKLPASTTRTTFASKTSAPTKAVARKPAPRVSSLQPQSRPSTLSASKPFSSTGLTSSTATSKPTQPAPPPSTTATKRKTSRSLSTSKPGFVPSKSGKPPTKSNFTLPGDAIAAKMKAARDERLKKEEEAHAEAARKRTEFKARPVPKSTGAGAGGAGGGRVSSVLPRETAASRARMSLMAARKDEDGKENAGPAAAKKGVAGSASGSVRVAPTLRKSVVPMTTQSGSGSMTARSVARRSVVPSTTQFGLSVTKARTGPPVATATAATRANKTTVHANSAVRRTTTTNAAPSKTRQSTAQTTTTPAIRSSSDRSSSMKPATATGTTKGKEVFSRGKLAEEDLLKQKREKEEAAKKARIEAAERGRMASKEWAEKQKKRKTILTAEKVKVEGGEV